MNLVLHLSSTSYIPLIFSLTYLTFLHVIYLPVCVYIYIYIYVLYYFKFIRVSHYSVTLQYTTCMYYVILRFFLRKKWYVYMYHLF